MGDTDHKGIGFWGIVAIGVGGMVGGGIFAVLGLSVQLAQGAAPLAFAVGGLVTLLTAYSYTKLSVTYPDEGGTVVFLDRAFNPGIIVGGFNVLLWASYVVMLSLYAYAFGSYGSTFFSEASRPFAKHLLISASIIGITGLNMLKADVISRAETWIVAIKVTILLAFVAIGLFGVDTSRLSPGAWADPLHVIAGGMIVFVAYEGFELIANTAQDVRDPKRVLPKAFFTAVIFVIALYILVAIVTVGGLSLEKIQAAQDYALAAAAEPFLGATGFIIISIAALLSTSSAINATLYGAARLSFTIAKERELPEALERQVWHRPIEGLFITTILTLLMANLVDLSSISTVGSAGFLLIFGAVNAANMKLHQRTGGSVWISGAGLVACLLALAALIWQTITTQPSRLLILTGMLVLALGLETVYRTLRQRPLHLQRNR